LIYGGVRAELGDFDQELYYCDNCKDYPQATDRNYPYDKHFDDSTVFSHHSLVNTSPFAF